MNTVRFNITLPIDVARKLKNERNKSAFIANSIREKMERDERERIKQELAEAYKASANEDRSLSEEWDGASGDGIA